MEGPLGTLGEVVRGLLENPDNLRQLVDFSDLTAKLPPELSNDGGSLRFDDPRWMAEMLSEAEPLLVERLLGKETAE